MESGKNKLLFLFEINVQVMIPVNRNQSNINYLCKIPWNQAKCIYFLLLIPLTGTNICAFSLITINRQ